LTLRSGRANVGVTVNLTHELAAGNGARLPEIIRLVAPCLTMVTINGATDRPDLGGSNRIKLLGEGDYDVGAIVRTLAEVKYHGPIGVQFYSIKGDPDANLRATMSAWRKMTGSATPINQAP
jgi:sugar phosphate isomerase/epimerase